MKTKMNLSIHSLLCNRVKVGSLDIQHTAEGLLNNLQSRNLNAVLGLVKLNQPSELVRFYCITIFSMLKKPFKCMIPFWWWGEENCSERRVFGTNENEWHVANDRQSRSYLFLVQSNKVTMSNILHWQVSQNSLMVSHHFRWCKKNQFASHFINCLSVYHTASINQANMATTHADTHPHPAKHSLIYITKSTLSVSLFHSSKAEPEDKNNTVQNEWVYDCEGSHFLTQHLLFWHHLITSSAHSTTATILWHQCETLQLFLALIILLLHCGLHYLSHLLVLD